MQALSAGTACMPAGHNRADADTGGYCMLLQSPYVLLMAPAIMLLAHPRVPTGV
jgi:hypothetical protein